MAEALGVAAALTGLIVPALQGIRLLLADIKKITDAPTAVERLQQDLISLGTTLKSLGAIEDAEWTALGDTVAEQSKTAISTCKAACQTFHGDLQRWTRHSQDGKLSWRDRANVGFFKEHQIKAMSEHLQVCKLTCSTVIGIATLYSSIRNTHITEDVKKQVANKQQSITAATEVVDARLREVETSLSQMKVVDTARQTESENDDLMSAVPQLEEELTALKSMQVLLPELRSRAKMEEIQKFAGDGHHSITTVTFGDNNSGLQSGFNYGSISGIQFGRAT